jgi:hypothetical protein
MLQCTTRMNHLSQQLLSKSIFIISYRLRILGQINSAYQRGSNNQAKRTEADDSCFMTPPL